MDVRLTFGTRKGQICDVEPSTAIEMLKDGRAERPCADQFPASPELKQPVAVAEVPHRRRRGANA